MLFGVHIRVHCWNEFSIANSRFAWRAILRIHWCCQGRLEPSSRHLFLLTENRQVLY
jgi:hypothetical protein